MIQTVNFHLWKACNMRCSFCFATFEDVKKNVLPKGHLPKERAIEVVNKLAEHGFSKITFAGGEPTLCPWLTDLIKVAKMKGLTTMIVTNGSKLDNDFLNRNKEYLDWITISIDSINPNTNLKSGRAISGNRPLYLNDYKNVIDRVKNFGYELKINTVVSKENYLENLSEIICYSKPKRWKIFQVLPIKGQNDDKVNDFTIGHEEFKIFMNNHKQISGIDIVSENNFDMKGSYVMVDPAGRFYDNNGEKYIYSESILKIGINQALEQVSYCEEKFQKRGGVYDWTIEKK